MNGGVEIWRGGVATWECDEMGHMNVRFYVVRAMEGLVEMAAALGMPRAFTAAATSTLVVREHHIRFLHEARAGAALHMVGGVLEMGEHHARLIQLLVHSGTGQIAASFQTEILHVTPHDARPFPWPAAARQAAERLRVELPREAAPRGVSRGPVDSRASLEEAVRLRLDTLAHGALFPTDCDVFGRMRAEQVIGRIAHGLPHYSGSLRGLVEDAEPDPERGIGGAAVEYRVVYHDWPRAGDRMQLCSGLAEAAPMVRRLVHWLVDPASGRPWASAEMVSMLFDLNARRAIALPAETVERLKGLTKPGLSL